VGIPCPPPPAPRCPDRPRSASASSSRRTSGPSASAAGQGGGDGMGTDREGVRPVVSVHCAAETEPSITRIEASSKLEKLEPCAPQNRPRPWCRGNIPVTMSLATKPSAMLSSDYFSPQSDPPGRLVHFSGRRVTSSPPPGGTWRGRRWRWRATRRAPWSATRPPLVCVCVCVGGSTPVMWFFFRNIEKYPCENTSSVEIHISFVKLLVFSLL